MTKSVVAQSYGTSEALTVVDVEVPPPASGEVLVEVKAIGVNPIDYKLYSGAFGDDPEKLPVRVGGEAAGVVAAVGAGVTEIAVGDEVIVSQAPVSTPRRWSFPSPQSLPNLPASAGNRPPVCCWWAAPRSTPWTPSGSVPATPS